MVMVLDDICRDTYEKNLRKQRIENLGNPAYEEPPIYDQYQKQRKALVTEREATTSATEMEPHYNIRTPITLPIESIRSNGSLIHQSFSKSKIDLLEKILNDIMIETHSKGISVSVGVPDKGIWSAARGTTGNTEKEKITPDLKFYAGSIGKIFTATIILKLVEEGLLRMECPIAKWFPEIDWANHITIDHLLTHTSGIPGFDNVKEYESNKYRYRNPHKIISYLENKKLLFKPGAHYAYSNTGYLMLGIIIERITGKSYKETIEYYITNKINLHETDVITSESVKKLIVRGHHNGNVLTETDNYVFPFAAGSIISTPKDLIIFFQTLMSGKLLTKDSLQKMVSDMNLMTVKQTTYYGKGIVAALGTPIGNIIGHTGGIRGFGSSLFYHPEKNIFACVMMNDDIKAADPAMFKLMETMMKM